jgi:hypothetical protein
MSDEQPKEEHDSIVDTRLAQAKARFGDRFDAVQWTEIREQIAETVKQANRLKSVPMGNADEPEIVFVPYRADDPVWGTN